MGTYVIIFQKNIVFLSMKIYCVFANSADPDEMPHDAAFHLDLHCLSKYPFRVSGLNSVKDTIVSAPQSHGQVDTKMKPQNNHTNMFSAIRPSSCSLGQYLPCFRINSKQTLRQPRHLVDRE